ncbi:MAG: hypothetical protein MUC48_22110 [Leptolyngbya sp. Prado105]|nr:hypothetical protein [Leptolyngbya sp. Prado105]
MLVDQGVSGEGISRFTQDGVPDTAIADSHQATFPLFPLRSTGTGCTIRVGIQDFEPSSNSIRTIGQFALCSTIVPVLPEGTWTRLI